MLWLQTSGINNSSQEEGASRNDTHEKAAFRGTKPMRPGEQVTLGSAVLKDGFAHGWSLRDAGAVVAVANSGYLLPKIFENTLI